MMRPLQQIRGGLAEAPSDRALGETCIRPLSSTSQQSPALWNVFGGHAYPVSISLASGNQ
jgi:hypothetical protein